MADKVLVARETRKVRAVVLLCPAIDLAQRLLLNGEKIKDEEGNEFAVSEDARASSFAALLFLFFRLG